MSPPLGRAAMPSPPPAAEPIDYWRAVAQRGVLALGFRRFQYAAQPDMLAEPIMPLEGRLRRAAHAAIEVHKLIAAEPGTAAHAARQVLADQLQNGAAIDELAAYQALLLERFWREIAEAPAGRIEALAYPHQDDAD